MVLNSQNIPPLLLEVLDIVKAGMNFSVLKELGIHHSSDILAKKKAIVNLVMSLHSSVCMSTWSSAPATEKISSNYIFMIFSRMS
jgi:hypothetical protein